MEREGVGGRSAVQPSSQVQLKLCEPRAHHVFLAGDFNGWDKSAHKLSEKREGFWYITIELPPGRYEYRFFVDGEWRIDPDAGYYTTDRYGTLKCVITVE